MDNEVVERIELKIAFLERANHELSDVVYRQQRELDALRLQLTNAMGRIDELKHEAQPDTQQEERPPHYWVSANYFAAFPDGLYGKQGALVR